MVFVSCLSLVCPLGYSAASASAALRAKITAFSNTVYRDVNGQQIIGASVGALSPELRGQERLVALINLAIEKRTPAFDDRLQWNRVPLIVCSRESQRPGARIGGIMSDIGFPGGATFAGDRAVHVALGPPSVLEAVRLARTIFTEQHVPACLILAVDSLVEARVIHWLDRTHRLKTSAQTDGVIPGEAAGLAVVSKEPLSADHVSVLGVGAAMESAAVLNDAPFRADGMTEALRRAFQETSLAMHDVDFRVSDVAGESYAFEELVLAQTRLMRKVRAQQSLWHPADGVGDCGAVAGLIQLAWLAEAFQRNYAPGPVVACHTASAFGQRAAALVASPDWKYP